MHKQTTPRYQTAIAEEVNAILESEEYLAALQTDIQQRETLLETTKQQLAVFLHRLEMQYTLCQADFYYHDPDLLAFTAAQIPFIEAYRNCRQEVVLEAKMITSLYEVEERGQKAYKKAIASLQPEQKKQLEAEKNRRGLLKKYAEEVFPIKTAEERKTLGSQEERHLMLMGDFIRHKEITFVNADTGWGKSALVVQLAHTLCSGKDFANVFKNEVGIIKVILYDLELDNAQFYERYKNLLMFDTFLTPLYKNNIPLPIGISKKDLLLYSIEIHVQETHAEVVIIDNMTALLDNNVDPEETKLLMDRLKALKEQLGIALIIVTHPPKINHSEARNINEVAGSKILVNFADAIITLGISVQHTDYRYLKQLKQRGSKEKYGKNNVVTFLLTNDKEGGNLRFEHLGYDKEILHLRERKEREQRKDVLENPHKEAVLERVRKGEKYRDIAQFYQIAVSTVSEWVKKQKEKEALAAPQLLLETKTAIAEGEEKFDDWTEGL